MREYKLKRTDAGGSEHDILVEGRNMTEAVLAYCKRAPSGTREVFAEELYPDLFIEATFDEDGGFEVSLCFENSTDERFAFDSDGRLC